MNTLASPVAAPSPTPSAVPLIAASWRPAACHAAVLLACVLAGLGLLAVRLRWPLSGRLTLAYGLGLALLSAVTVWIWQLSWIPLAAAVFHLAGLVLLVLAWRDGAGLWEAHRAARNHRA